MGIFPEIEVWKIGQKYMVGTSNLGSWHGHWPKVRQTKLGMVDDELDKTGKPKNKIS